MKKINLSDNFSDICHEMFATEFKSIFKTVDTIRKTVVLLMFLHAAVGLFAVMGNAFIIFTISKSPNLHKPSYLLMAGMAANDLFVGLLFYPFQIIRLTFFKEHSVNGICSTNDVFNTLSTFLYGMCFVMSLMISIDRYLALTLKHRYRIVVTKRRVILATLSAFTIALIVSSCINIIPVLSAFRRSIVLVIGLLLLFITSAFYIRSFLALRRHTKCVRVLPDNTAQNSFNCQKYKRSLKTMVIILAWLIVCYIPLLFGNYKSTNKESTKFSVIFLHVCLILFGVNSCTNPLIYLLRFTDIRSAAGNVILKSFSRFTSQHNSQLSRNLSMTDESPTNQSPNQR